MEDRVADVLAERAALDHGAAAGVIVSAFLHGTATALVIYAAMHQPPAKTASLINIRLAPPRAVAPEAPKVPRIEPPKPQPVKPVATVKPPEKNTVPLSPFGKSTKKGSETPEPPKPTTVTPPVPIGGTGVTGIEGDFPYTLYIERMRTLIGGRWFRPQITTGAATTIYFFINRDGSIRDARVEVPSGNPTFDRAALRAVLEASPLPPLPFGYGGTYLGVHLSFR
jgi:TonB family protein